MNHSPAFERWKEQARAVPIMDEIARRGVKLRREGSEFIGPCPLCRGDDRFAVNTKKQVWNCRGCGVGGDVIELVRHLDGVDFIEACTILAGPPPQNGKDTAPAARAIPIGKHIYPDESGAVLFAVGRYEYQNSDGSFVLNKDGKHKKSFRQKRPDPDHPGKWIGNVDGVRVVPYKLPEVIEAIGNDNSIAIVEGEAKADLLWSWNVPATCNAGGAGKWKPEHSEFLRDADVVIIPDNDDPGRDHADIVGQSSQGIAKSVRVLELPVGPKQDIVDWAKQGGTVEQLYDLSKRESKPWTPRKPEQQAANEEIKKPAEQQPDSGLEVFDAGLDIELPQASKDNKRDRFKLEALDDIVIGDDPIELIPGILPMGPALGVGYGPPKSLKSFLLMHALLHVAGNIPYCGRDVQAGAVVYVTSEGVSGARRRLVGARRALGLEGKRVPFFLVPAMPNLGAGPQDREELRRKIAQTLEGLGVPLRAILLDTMRRAMPGKSENKPEDVSVVVDNCEALARAFNCLVMLIHHSPRSDEDRGSGSNALDAAADVMIGCKRDSVTKIATAIVRHLKDGEEGDTWQFELNPIEVGVDRDGNPIISRYVQITEEPERRAAPPPGKSLSAEQQRVFDILVGAVAEVGIVGLAGSAAPANTRAITRDTFTEFLKHNGWWDAANDSSARAKMSSRLNEIAGKHRIGLTDRCVWPVLFTAR
jgi:hypothetical protein